MIYILGSHDETVGILANDDSNAAQYWDDEVKEKLNDAYITLNFTTEANHPESGVVVGGNKAVITDQDGDMQMFEIKTVEDVQGEDGSLNKQVYAEHVALELNGRIIRPQEVRGMTAADYVRFVVGDTRWQVGTVEWFGTQTIVFDDFKTGIEALLMGAEAYGGEFKFRVEMENGTIKNLFIDLVNRRGIETGIQITTDHNQRELRRIEDASQVYTALIGVARGEDSGYMTFETLNKPDKPFGQDWIGNEAALQKYGILLKNGERQHYFGVYVFDENRTITKEELLQKTRDRLKEVSKPKFTYECNVVDLGALAQYDHERFRLGDTLSIMNNDFNPTLLVEARIVEYKWSKTNPASNSVVLGDYRDIWAETRYGLITKLRNTIVQNIADWEASGSGETIYKADEPPANPVKDMLWLDTSNPNLEILRRYDGTEWRKATATEAVEVGAETPQGAQDKADQAEENAKDYAQSRAGNLVTNGTGALLNNTNFSQFTFSGKEVYSGSGSFFTDKQNGILENDELIPVNISQPYRMSLMAKSTQAVGKNYFGITPYDVDGYPIQPFHYYGSQRPIVTLAQDLKPGDTVIHLTSTEGIDDGRGNNSHFHSLVFWGYKNSFGYQYPDGTYSRLVFTNGWLNGGIDRINNTITLSKPFNLTNPEDVDGIFRAGHTLSGTQSAAVYKYIAASNVIVPTTWTKYSGEIKGIGIGNGEFPPGTANIRLLFLTNRDTSGGQAGDSLYISTIEFLSVAQEKNAIEESIQQTEDFVYQYAERKISKGPTPPQSPEQYDLWIDTNGSRPLWKQWTGTVWEEITRTNISEMLGQLDIQQIPDLAITANKLVDDAITEAKIATGAVTTSKIVANAVTAEKIAAKIITAAQIAVGAVTANEIAANSIQASNIAANAITANEIAANAISTNHISAAGLDAGVITFGVMSGERIKVGTLDANKLKAGSIIAGDITFTGTLDGADGTFSGQVVVGDAYTSTARIAFDANTGRGYMEAWKYILQGGGYADDYRFTIDGDGFTFGHASTTPDGTTTYKTRFYQEKETMRIDAEGSGYKIRFQLPYVEFVGSYTDINSNNMRVYATAYMYGTTNFSSNVNLNGDTYFGSISSYTRYRPAVGHFETNKSETGFCGVGGRNGSMTGAMAGVGVSFRVKKTYIPSVINLSGTSNNLANSADVQAIDISPDGFWLYLNSRETGNLYKYWRGYYTA